MSAVPLPGAGPNPVSLLLLLARALRLLRLDGGAPSRCFELGYAFGVDIETDHRRALPAEGDGDRLSDISLASSRVLFTPSFLSLVERISLTA